MKEERVGTLLEIEEEAAASCLSSSAKSLDKIQEVDEIINAVESISGFLPKTSHNFRVWYIDVGSESLNLFLTFSSARIGLKFISGDPLPKTILSSLAHPIW
jgi:hypothetical protein